MLYGAAEHSRDLDLAVLATPETLPALRGALDALNASVIDVPSFELRYLERWHAVHFSIPDESASPLRVDVMSRLRGVDAFPLLWERRTTVALSTGHGDAEVLVEVMALVDLVAARKTQRDKDWPMLRRLVDASFAAALVLRKIKLQLRERARSRSHRISFLSQLRTLSVVRNVRVSGAADAAERSSLAPGAIEVLLGQPTLEGRLHHRPFGIDDGEPRGVAAAILVDDHLPEDALEGEAVAMSGGDGSLVPAVALPLVAPIAKVVERMIRYMASDLQGRLLLTYIHNRITEQMLRRKITEARSLILLKHWNEARTDFEFRYWEEDFLGWIEELVRRNEAGEIEWVTLSEGLHGRDRDWQDEKGKNVRLVRMHYKHNQIFTDHTIPAASEVESFKFAVSPLSWDQIADMVRSAQPRKPLSARRSRSS